MLNLYARFHPGFSTYYYRKVDSWGGLGCAATASAANSYAPIEGGDGRTSPVMSNIGTGAFVVLGVPAAFAGLLGDES